MRSRQQAGDMLAIVLAGGCAHLKIWYTNGIPSVCLWHQEQQRNIQERLCSPCQAVYLSQVWAMGGREEIKHSIRIIQSHGQSWLSEKNQSASLLPVQKILTKDILPHGD